MKKLEKYDGAELMICITYMSNYYLCDFYRNYR
jgi:hypothetical protein